MFFGLGSSAVGDSSFVLSVTEGTPSPQRKASPKKYKLGTAFSDDDGEDMLGRGDFLSVLSAPGSSTSVSTSYSSDGEALATPGTEPSRESWQIAEWDFDVEKSFGSGISFDDVSDMDKFIMKTLVAGGKGVQEGDGIGKRLPGTPVKKVKKRDLVDLKPGVCESMHTLASD
jgi:hypothetical protein